MFVPYIEEIKSDMDHRDMRSIRIEYTHTFDGIKKTLFCMGVGYFGATNTPEDLENLSFINDLIFAKAHYLYLKEKGENLPDFQWLSDQIY